MYVWRLYLSSFKYIRKVEVNGNLVKYDNDAKYKLKGRHNKTNESELYN